jgi:hypothetical protein
VEFYGQVLDQDSQPLPGVKVTMNLSAVREIVPGLPDGVFEDLFRGENCLPLHRLPLATLA